MALVIAPGPVVCLATGRSPGRRECRAAQLLGARHLVQAAVTAFAPLPDVLAMGAVVDAVHAASMLILATAGRGARRAALTDALAEALFAAGGLSFDRGLRWSPGRRGQGSCPNARRSPCVTFAGTALRVRGA